MALRKIGRSLKRKAGRIAKRIAKGVFDSTPLGGVVNAVTGIGKDLGIRLPRTGGGRPPLVSVTSGGIPSGSLLPPGFGGGFGGVTPLTPPPPMRPPTTISVGAVANSPIAIYGVSVAGALARSFFNYLKSLGAVLTFEEVNNLMGQPLGNWPTSFADVWTPWTRSDEAQRAIMGSKGVSTMGMDPCDLPVCVPAELKTIHAAPRGYVIVEKDGQKVAMEKTMARKFGYYKPSAKPPISATEFKQAKAAARVEKKIARLAGTMNLKCEHKKTGRR